MKKQISLVMLFVVGIFFSTGVMASAERQNNKQDSGKSLMPLGALEVSPGFFDIGQKYDNDSHSMVQGYAFVDSEVSNATLGAPVVSALVTPLCYGFFAPGAKWKFVEPWYMNTSNPDALPQSTLFSIMNNSIGKWESASRFNIIGTGFLTNSVLNARRTSPDGFNEVFFGDLGTTGVIAVTVVWGHFSGVISAQDLIEWDQEFNTNYHWSTSGESTKMDFENIATHELGHALGLTDMYDTACSAVSMYGYAVAGQTQKRSLEAQDIAGIFKLYH